jgi:hypothetical protein
MGRDEVQRDTSRGVRFRRTDRFRCGLDREFPKRRHVSRPSRKLEPPGRIIPVGNAYGGPGFDSARENDSPSCPHLAARSTLRAPRNPPPRASTPHRPMQSLQD